MKKILKTLTLILPSLALVGCGEPSTDTASENNNTFTPVELKSCGSTSVDKVITALGSKFADLTGNKVTLKKNQTGSGDATVGVTTGKNNTKYDIGFLSREIKENERATLTDTNKDGTMCKDAVVPIVNSKNAYAKTDAATLTSMYKGEKKAWNEIDPSLANKNIKLYSRESGSGTRECFFEGIGYGAVKAEDKFVVEVSKQSSNGDMMRAIKDDEYGIGYCSLDSLSSANGIKALSFEGVEASIETVNNGQYKLSRNFNYVIRGDYEENDSRKMAVNAFVDFMSTKEGLASIQTAGGIISNLNEAPTWSSIQTSKYPLLAK